MSLDDFINKKVLTRSDFTNKHILEKVDMYTSGLTFYHRIMLALRRPKNLYRLREYRHVYMYRGSDIENQKSNYFGNIKFRKPKSESIILLTLRPGTLILDEREDYVTVDQAEFGPAFNSELKKIKHLQEESYYTNAYNEYWAGETDKGLKVHYGNGP